MSERTAVIDGKTVRYRVRPVAPLDAKGDALQRALAVVEGDLMTPAEVAALFRVDPKTVTRWADAGYLTAIRTLGGHRRYLRSQIMTALENGR